MPVDVPVEHPLDEGALELGPGAGERVETRPRDALPPLEVEDAEGLADLPVGTRLEVEHGEVGVVAEHDVAALVLAVRDVLRGGVGQPCEDLVDLRPQRAAL